MRMRKRFHMIAAAAFALLIVAGGCAKEKPPPQPQPAKKETSETAKTVAPKPKPHAKLFTGTIEAVDEAAGTLTLKGPKGAMDFQVHEKAKDQLDDLKIGDKVIVKHVDEIALAIVKPRTSKSALICEEKKVL
jgi:ABC-type sugar transport system substrate-binding protein